MKLQQPLPKLGVGLAFQSPIRPFIERNEGHFDFLEVVPDILWTDLGTDHSPRYIEEKEGISFLQQVREAMVVIPHSIGLSIGSAHRFNRDHLDQIAGWYERLRFPWHSDHLSYNLAEHGVEEMNIGVTLPLPFDRETLDMLVPRVLEIRSRIPVPFLLENNVYYFDLPDQEFDEPEFLNRLCQMSGCGLLLDLHNIYVNHRNLGYDPFAFLDRLDLDNVVEVHVAGGMEHDGFYLDAHSGPLPGDVWKLLEHTLPRCPNLGGVVFELFGSWFVDVGEERLAVELDRLKEMWSKYQPEPVRSAAIQEVA